MNDYVTSTPNIPRLSGRTLRAFVTLLETPMLNALLISSVRKNAGVNELLSLRINDPPLYYPSHPRPDELPTPVSDVEAWWRALPDVEEEGRFPLRVRYFVQAYGAGTLTPVDVAHRVVEAIRASDQGDPPLRAFIASDVEDVMRQAEASTRRWQEGRPLSPLDGVPIAVKDELDQVPYGTTMGTAFLGHRPASRDATAVARLRASGALLVGKTNMHEIGISVTGVNPHHGVARNPYDVRHISGGSSSGSAVAVAAGIVPIALGVDGGGSIRIPAALCGTVGLMPTFGRVSEFGSAPLDWSLSHVGVLAGTLEDAALAYAIIAGPDPLDRHTHHQPRVSLEGVGASHVRGLKLGVYRPWFQHADDYVVAAAEEALEQLARLGAEIKEVVIPELDVARSTHATLILSEMAAGMASYYNAHRRDFGLDVRVNLALGRSFAAWEYVHAQRMRFRLTQHVLRALKEVDVIVTPTVAMVAPPVPEDALPEGESNLSLIIALMRHTFLANLVGVPSLTVPVGYHEGLPIGLQFMGRPWEEHVILRAGYVVERYVPRRAPQVLMNVLGA